MTKADDTHTITTDQPPTNGNGSKTPLKADSQLESQNANKSSTPAPPSVPSIQFSQAEYLTKGSVLVTIERTGESKGDARVFFTAREEAAANDGYLDKKEIVFVNGEDFQSFSLGVKPNFSDAPVVINLSLTNPENAQLGNPHEAVVLVQPISGNREIVKTIIEPVTTNPNVGRVFRHILLGLALIGSIYFLDFLVGSYADRHKQNWDVYLNPKTKTELVFLNDSPFQIKEHEQNRFRDQLLKIRAKEDLHRELMEFYYKGYYMGIIVLSFSAALAAITLLLISKRGWAATSEYIITTFFIMTCASLFYGSWAGLFKQEENITTNKVLYLKYSALENELFSYVTTGEALNYNFTTLVEMKPAPSATPAPEGNTTQANTQAKSAKTTSATTSEQAKKSEPQIAQAKIGIKLDIADFIHYVDLQLAQDNIAIGFDYSQIPNYKNAFSNVGTTK